MRLLPNTTLLLVKCVFAAHFRATTPSELQAAMSVIVYNFRNPTVSPLEHFVFFGSTSIADPCLDLTVIWWSSKDVNETSAIYRFPYFFLIIGHYGTKNINYSCVNCS
jgi:hypothetical protein